MVQGARGWCTEMTQRDGMGREVGGVFVERLSDLATAFGSQGLYPDLTDSLRPTQPLSAVLSLRITLEFVSTDTHAV